MRLIEKCESPKEWFCDLAVFEKHLTDAKGNSADPLLFAAFYYASLCDKLLYLTTKHSNRSKGFDCVLFQSESFFKERLIDRSSKELFGFRRDHMLWDLTNDGHFSMLDYLIVLGEGGFLLSSTCQDVKARDDFSSHVGVYEAHRGTLQHDVDHVQEAAPLFQSFQQYGLQVGAYTKECFADTNPQNTLELGQKILITFVTLHEFAPTFCTSMERTLLPKMTYLPDLGLMDLLPVFMDASADIDERSSQGQETSPEEGMLRALHSWREKYLGEINRRYINKAHDAVLHKTRQP